MKIETTRRTTAGPGTAAAEAGLTPAQVALLKERLLAEREAVGQRLAARRHALVDTTSRATDEADWASDSASQGLVARLVDRDAKLLREIEAALHRLAVGTYGVCTLSGEPIGFERLTFRPWTRHALAAKEGVERERARTRQSAGVVVDVGDEPSLGSARGDDEAA
jgi:DnaK suppressor protein